MRLLVILRSIQLKLRQIEVAIDLHTRSNRLILLAALLPTFCSFEIEYYLMNLRTNIGSRDKKSIEQQFGDTSNRIDPEFGSKERSTAPYTVRNAAISGRRAPTPPLLLPSVPHGVTRKDRAGLWRQAWFLHLQL